jgi:hypothetical protein
MKYPKTINLIISLTDAVSFARTRRTQNHAMHLNNSMPTTVNADVPIRALNAKPTNISIQKHANVSD